MSGKAQAPAQPATSEQRPAGYVEALFADSCEGVMSQEDLDRMLKETVQLLLNTHRDNPMTGLEQMLCNWRGTSRIPGRDIGVYSRELTIGFNRNYPNERVSVEDTPRQAAFQFSGRFSEAAGFVPFQIPGTDRAVRYSNARPKSIWLGMQTSNIFIEVSYDNPDMAQEQVDQEALNLTAKLLEQLRK